MPNIHSSAIVEAGADVHPSARIGPFSIVEAGASIGEGCNIESHVRVYAHTRMGRDNTVCHGATIGSVPQDLSYSADRAKPLTIGDGNHFKECVNISHGIKEDHGTRLGNENYLMAFSHVGHDCIVGDNNILANGATLAGHVQLGNRVFLSGHVAVHQFCRVGDYVMVGGLTGVRQDVPPFAMANGHGARYIGLNLVGLRRAGFSPASRNTIKQVYKRLMHGGEPLRDVLDELRQDGGDELVTQIVRFFDESRRGVISAD